MHERSTTIFLSLLLCADVALIALHVIFAIFEPDPALCSISGICAAMSAYNLIKYLWVVVLFAYVAGLVKDLRYVSWVLVFACLLADDALHLHQRAGDLIAAGGGMQLLPDLGWPPRLLQLAVLGAAAIPLLAIVAWAYMRGNIEFRKISNDMFLLLAGLVFFGLIVDAGTAVRLRPSVLFGLGIVEDGGEILVNSLILWDTFRLAMFKAKPSAFLLDLLH